MKQKLKNTVVLIFVLSLFVIPQKASSEDQSAEILNLPAQILPPIIPDDNPITRAKVELGRKLYFDKRLSVDDTVSCATCHDPSKGFGDAKPVAEGIKKLKGARNSPTTLNAAFFDLQFWDGRAETLEDQAILPLINPVEMGMLSHDAVVAKLHGISEYRQQFKEVFGTENFTINHIAKAIASFERTLVSLNSPFDRFIAGDVNAISESAKKGWELFNGKARCNTCHGYIESYPFFTDNKFHNVGVGAKNLNFDELARRAAAEQDLAKLTSEEGSSELGRFLITNNKSEIGAFKTSGLREIELTGPYMHDGSEATLEKVMELYNRGGVPNPYLDGGMRPLDLTKEEMSSLVDFLKTLTSDDAKKLQEKFSQDMEKK